MAKFSLFGLNCTQVEGVARSLKCSYSESNSWCTCPQIKPFTWGNSDNNFNITSALRITYWSIHFEPTATGWWWTNTNVCLFDDSRQLRKCTNWSSLRLPHSCPGTLESSRIHCQSPSSATPYWMEPWSAPTSAITAGKSWLPGSHAKGWL